MRTLLLLVLVAAFLPAAPPSAADIGSLDGILAALYDVISGDAGQERDWERFQGLFAPQARLIPIRRNAEGASLVPMTPAEFAERARKNTRTQGFYEQEFSRKTDQFGGLIHVFSTYRAKRGLTDKEPFARGINSIQAFHDGKRYWIVTVFWEQESKDRPLPQQYLK
jgi:hypothetical protein